MEHDLQDDDKYLDTWSKNVQDFSGSLCPVQRPKNNNVFFQFLTDMMFTRCTDKFATTVASHGATTYGYSFDYRGQYSIVNLQGEQVDMGVVHGDDLQYVFQGLYGEEYPISTSDRKFSKNIMLPLLTNFAKTR